MPDAPIWISEAEVVGLISLPEAIDALERTLALEAEAKAASMPKTHLMVAHNDAMHAIGGAASGEGICGFKTWINVQGKSETTMTLFSMEDGACLAVIEATALEVGPSRARAALACSMLYKLCEVCIVVNPKSRSELEPRKGRLLTLGIN